MRQNENGDDQIQPPVHQSAFQLQLYSDMGIRAEYDANGVETKAGIRPTNQTGHWYLMALPADAKLPAKLRPMVISSGLRSDGLPLPIGVKGFNTILA